MSRKHITVPSLTKPKEPSKEPTKEVTKVQEPLRNKHNSGIRNNSLKQG